MPQGLFSTKIYLIGFMGAGKSTVGRLLAKRCQLPLLDTDDEFARLHDGMTTGEYISAFGVEAFRPEEARTLRLIAQEAAPAVIATGGGVPTYGDNLTVMRQSGVVIHLRVPLGVIEARMSAQELRRRPLWATRTPEEVQSLYNDRLAIYNGAHLTIDGNCPPEAAVLEIMKHLPCQ